MTALANKYTLQIQLKLRILRRNDYPELLMWVCTWGSQETENLSQLWSETDMVAGGSERFDIAGLKMVGAHKLRNLGGLAKLEKAKKCAPPYRLQKGTSQDFSTLILA